VEALAAALKRTTRAVKLMLLDQELVAGLGNIYVAEALFLAGIHPGRRAHQLRASQVEPLHRAIVAVLTQGVENRGTSLSDYVDAQGVAGNNQAFLKVYGRAGERCVRCGGTVRGVVMGQRSTFYCPGCQPSRK
jgi:formamidopyrimidine-DNA glycosylase